MSSQPFLTFLTPTFRRPQALNRCIASVQAQTRADVIEQIVLPDFVGRGIVGGLYGRMPMYADAVHGRYVHVLADDDVLPAPELVAQVMAVADRMGDPPVIVVQAQKGPLRLPSAPLDPPQIGNVDMGCYIQRADIFKQFAPAYCSGRYEGDFDHANALWKAGVPVVSLDLLFVVGGQGRGAPEVAA